MTSDGCLTGSVQFISITLSLLVSITNCYQFDFNLIEEESAGDLGYIFDPDYLPQQRQQFYQLCDLHSDALQAIINSNKGKEMQCNVSFTYIMLLITMTIYGQHHQR